MSNIADQLAAAATSEVSYRPEVRLDYTGGYVDGPARPVGTAPAQFVDLAEKHQLDGWRLDPGKPVGVSRWMQVSRDPKTGDFVERWLEADRFFIIPTSDTAATLADYLGALKAEPPADVRTVDGRAVFNFQASDLQIGKVDNGGTDGILVAYRAAVYRAVNELEWARERHDIGAVHLMFPGDCIEGIVSQGGRNHWRTDLTVVEQRAVFERLLYETVAAFSRFGIPVHVSVVNGNHDQATRQQNTNPGDGWATSAADSLRNGLALNAEAYGHVTVHTPDPERGYMTVQVLDTVYVIAHGHQWRRGKAMQWWAEQTFHGQNPGAAHILVHGHEHTFSVEATADRIRICSLTFDGGSNYFRELHGAESRRGGLVYVTEGRHPLAIAIV